jgi:adenylylsulfate kinase
LPAAITAALALLDSVLFSQNFEKGRGFLKVSISRCCTHLHEREFAIHLTKRYHIFMAGSALWITGLPGSGKSTIADAIKARHPDFVILRMDELRKTVTPKPAYSDAERDIVYRSLVFLAKKLTDLGHDVIIDATGNMRKWRTLAREMIPHYTEIYLRCPLEACIHREGKRQKTRGAPRKIYKKGEKGWPVPGINVPYEEPLKPDIIIDTDQVTAREAAELIGEKIF